MPTFVRAIVSHGQVKLDYGFVLKLSSAEELLDYWTKKRASEFGVGLSNFLASKECEYLTRGTYSGKEHVSDPLAAVISHVCQIEAKKEGENEVTVKDVVDSLLTTTFRGMCKSISKTGAIYIQASGGYFPHSEDVIVNATIEQESYDFPIFDLTIKVFQWQGGKHFYAKVGHLDVVDVATGNQKWNTSEEAQRQAEIMAKALTKKKKYY